MANLCNYFIGFTDVILVNDIIPDPGKKEYQIDARVKRIYLDENIGNGNRNISRIKKIRSLIKQEKPDVVISFMAPPNIRTLLASIGLSVKKIVSVRNDPTKEYGVWVKKIITATLFSLTNGCVFQTAEAMQYFPSNVRKKSTIIFNPVHENFFEGKWEQQKKEIICVGRLTEQKNPFLAVEAFLKVEKEFPEYSLAFYGDGELRDRLVKFCIEKGISDRVLFYGQTDNVKEVLACSAIYLLPSNYEGMPNALMEAMAVGIPVVATNCPCRGPKALISSPNEGILVPCGDVDGFANAIRRILSDDEFCTELSKMEKKRAQAFLPSNILEAWKNYIACIEE